ncbi:hypothetical protein JVT61DRAFT_126 [Boletus reticuloceps]|uniref:Uncharacterized protein n=1 Tax=Boletus reticuloceps TaxID=495285 RepID=A0A8I2Z150_9AGAM|nr:hypothetical protein JVT61DRAFT_126 [Boletus reticuloceps]
MKSDPSHQSRTLSGGGMTDHLPPTAAFFEACLYVYSSDYDVCVECGSLAECEHDREVASTTVPAPLLSNVHPLSHDGNPTSSKTDYLEMRTVRPISPFSEVFNTYGSLPNAALLSRYGFVLPENEHDTVRMVLDPLSTMRNLFKCVGLEELSVGKDIHAVIGASAFERFAIRNGCRDRGQGIGDDEGSSLSVSAGAWENTMNRLLHVFTYVAGMWSSDAAWDEPYDDGLVFNPQSPLTGSVSFQAGDDDGPSRITRDLVINSDGKISHNLWLFCILVALFAARSHLGTSLGDLMERVERGPEGIASLTEFKATLINAQRYVERLRHIHDRDSDDGDMEDSGNHGSTSSPPLPHPALSSLKLDYDTESDDCAQPAAAVPSQPRPAITPKDVVMGRPLGTGPQDPEISRGFLPISQASSDLSRGPMIPCHPTQGGAEDSYQETSMDHTTGYSAQRDRSPSAEGERPAKRVRRYSDSVVANRVDRLGRATPESARQGQHREVQDASDDAKVQMTVTDHDETHRMALMLARIVVCLCRDRYRPPTLGKEQRGVGMTAAELGDLLDPARDNQYWLPEVAL